jgi:O-antigen/teichoic acid export membrane protein
MRAHFLRHFVGEDVSARRALLVSYIDRYASIIVAFIASMIIARLLTPIEVGIFSVAMVLVGFLSPFRDFGASQFVIQCKELNNEILNTTRAIQFALGVLLSVCIFATSGWVAAFYGEPRIHDIMLLLAINSLLMPVGALSMALMNREVRFKALAAVRFSGAFLGASTSVLLAWRGYGPISLAYGALAGAAATSASAIYFRPVRIPISLKVLGAGKIVGFGGSITGISLLGMVRGNIAELSLGRLQGLAVSGLFGRAQGLVTMLQDLLIGGAYSAALPLFSKALREKKPLAPIYLNTVGMLSALGWSVFGLVACIATPLINILYGDQWLGAAPITQSLCIALLFSAPNLLAQAPLIALGKVNIVLAYVAGATVLHTILILIAAQYSLEMVGLAIIATAALLMLPFFAISQHFIGYSWSNLGKTLLHSALLAVSSSVVPIALLLQYGDKTNDSFLRILIATIGSALGFVAAALVSRHPIADEIKILLAALRKGVTQKKVDRT